MTRTLLQHADLMVTMNADRQELADGAVLVRDNAIEWVGLTRDLSDETKASVDRTINAQGLILLPGLVNTHHHFYQTLTRVIPEAQDSNLFNWLKTLYPIWAELQPGDVHVSTKLALLELLQSGCTTSSDHQYLWPNGCRLDDQFEAAEEIGVRFHGARGSMSLGESQGGLPPDRVTENEQAILQDSRRVVETYHDPARFAMRRVALAPCSPFSVSPDLMRESAELARSFGATMGVRLHTHLAETLDEEEFCIATFGYRPAVYAENLHWTGDDVWHAHCVHMNDSEISQFAVSRTGIAHCPTSNMRLGSGIAPIKQLVEAGVPVALGVDGSASNDGSHLLAESRMAMLLQRVQGDPSAMNARQALELATLGGARVLGRDDIGSIEPHKAADIIAFDLNSLALAGGALHDPVAALVFCQPQNVHFSMVNGRILIQNGEFVHIDRDEVIRKHNSAAKRLLERADMA